MTCIRRKHRRAIRTLEARLGQPKSHRTYYALGREKQSDSALRELIAKYNASNAFEIATVYAFPSQTDQAFDCLDLKSLHNDPRYAALLKKLNLPN